MPVESLTEDQTQSKLAGAKVLHVDADTKSRASLKETLQRIGFREIHGCEAIEELTERFEKVLPELVFVDIDIERSQVCQTIKDIRSAKLKMDDPFVVIVALTWKPEMEAVQAALQAGCDDMIVKPVTSKILRQRVVSQIEDRKNFIATADYVGPDRRPEDREKTEEDLDAIAVPNTLRHCVTGDKTAELTQLRVRQTLRNLSIQKFFHLSRQVSHIAEKCKELAEKDPNHPMMEESLKAIASALLEIDEINKEQHFESVKEVVASTHRVLAEVLEAKADLDPRQLDLINVHGHSIGSVLKESEESAGVLITELDRATNMLTKKTGDQETTADCGAAASTVNGGASEVDGSGSSPGADDEITQIPMKVRLKAWWEGCDPTELMAEKP